MYNRVIAGLVVVFTCAGGCRSFTSPARVHKLDDNVVWFDYDATRRGALLLPKGGTHRVISEPSPDVAMGVVAQFVAKASYQGISGEASGQVTEAIAELGKRTETIMFLREALFRLNELQTVANLDAGEISRLYAMVLDAALELAKVDQLKEAQTLHPKVVERLLDESARALRAKFDKLLGRKVKPDIVPGQTFSSMEAYAEYVVRNRFGWKDDTLYGIRWDAGDKLEALIAEMEKAAEQP